MKNHTQALQGLKISLNVLMIAGTAFFFSCEDPKGDQTTNTVQVKSKSTPIINYSLVNTFPHDTVCFTEGLLFHEGKLYESSGGMDYLAQSKSAFGLVDLEKGKWDVKVELDKNVYFGEGIVILNDKIYQVTYHNQTGFVYDAKTFKKIKQFNYRNKEGWGLTTDGKYIIMSDGTFNLTYFDPETLNEVKVVAVTESGYGLDHLNELEYIKGFIYANVWMTNYIVKINPETGEVLGKIELDELTIKAKAKNPRCLEMNGIAYDSISDKLLVTGKMWPYIYEIKVSL